MQACTLPDVVVNVLGVEKDLGKSAKTEVCPSKLQEQTWTEVLSELVGVVLLSAWRRLQGAFLAAAPNQALAVCFLIFRNNDDIGGTLKRPSS